jgi:hypothetical protein
MLLKHSIALYDIREGKILPFQRLRHLRQCISHHGHTGRVLAQLFGNDLVERIRRGVMNAEIREPVLPDSERRNSLFCERLNVGFRGLRRKLQQVGAEGPQDLLNRCELLLRAFTYLGVKTERMLGPEITLNSAA